MNLQKASKACQMSEADAKEMIVAHHELTKLTPKKQIKEIKGLELSSENLRWINQTAKKLKISSDAVISGILKIYLLNEENRRLD